MNATVRDWSAFDRHAARRAFVHVSGNRASTQLLIDGMHCGACALRIENALRALNGIEEVNVNAATRHASISFDLDRLPFSRVLAAIAHLGFEPRTLASSTDLDRAIKERRTAYKRLAVAGLAMMQVMTFAFGLYAGAEQGIEPQYELYLRIASMFVTLPVVSYSAVPLFAGALRDLGQRRLGMDVPVSLAIVLAFAASVYNTLRASGEVYFDSVTMFVFFLLLGRMVEMHTRHRAGSVSEALARLLPQSAFRLRDGRTQEVAATELEPGDLVRVPAGSVVPADGTVVDGTASLDESMLTGEAAAVTRRAGERVLGGSMNVGQPLTFRVSAVGAATVLSAIVRLLERAQAQRPRVARLADRAASHFIALILVAAVCVAIAWAWIDPSRAFPAVLAMLVVTCPCALSLATPTALAAATGRFARLGLLVTRADAIEALAQIRCCVFDKTGTLTAGSPRIVRVHRLGAADEAECRAMAAALEAASEHPLARAFVDPAAPVPPASDVHVAAGKGIEGVVAGRLCRVGTFQYVSQLSGESVLADVPGTAVFLGDRDGMLAAFELDDALRPQAAASVAALRELGIDVLMASGDHPETVSRVAQAVGIKEWHARLTPETKVATLQGLTRERGSVLMVGDGINDAPVLGAAAVSVAMGNGSALAQANADFVLANESLPALAEGIAHARRTRAIIRQNLIWAAVYNALAIPFAALGWVPPWAAAIGMSASSIVVVLNAARLARPPRRFAEFFWGVLERSKWPASCC